MKKTKKKLQAKRKQIQKRIQRQKRQIVMIFAAAIVLSLLVTVIAFFRMIEPVGAQRIVTFYDRGTEHTILTRVDTVREALQAAEIEVDAHDIVEPSQDSKLTSAYVDIIIYRSRPVAVIDGSLHQTVTTTAQSPNEILKIAEFEPLGRKDKTTFRSGDIVNDGAFVVLSVERSKLTPRKVTYIPSADALTASRGAQVFVDSDGVAHRETYYDLPMNIVIKACGPDGKYTIRADGAKIDQDGYVLVAANYAAYPRCTIVETSMGPGKVYDTGGFVAHHPYGFDLATDWTNYNGV